MTRHCALLALLIVCVYTELARGKLYDACTVPALVLGFGLSSILDAFEPGNANLLGSAAGCAVSGGALLIMWLLGGIGARDARFMAAVGALGADRRFAVAALFYVAVVGAIWAVAVLIWRGRFLRGLKDSLRLVGRWRSKRREPSALTIPYGMAIAIGSLWAWLEFFALG